VNPADAGAYAEDLYKLERVEEAMTPRWEGCAALVGVDQNSF
jgi:hypothetical protein